MIRAIGQGLASRGRGGLTGQDDGGRVCRGGRRLGVCGLINHKAVGVVGLILRGEILVAHQYVTVKLEILLVGLTDKFTLRGCGGEFQVVGAFTHHELLALLRGLCGPLLLILLVLGLQRAELFLHVAQLARVTLRCCQFGIEVGDVGVALLDLLLQRADLIVTGLSLRLELLGGYIATLGQIGKANVLRLVGLVFVHLVDPGLYLCVQLRGQNLAKFHTSSFFGVTVCRATDSFDPMSEGMIYISRLIALISRIEKALYGKSP